MKFWYFFVGIPLCYINFSWALHPVLTLSELVVIDLAAVNFLVTHFLVRKFGGTRYS